VISDEREWRPDLDETGVVLVRLLTRSDPLIRQAWELEPASAIDALAAIHERAAGRPASRGRRRDLEGHMSGGGADRPPLFIGPPDPRRPWEPGPVLNAGPIAKQLIRQKCGEPPSAVERLAAVADPAARERVEAYDALVSGLTKFFEADGGGPARERAIRTLRSEIDKAAGR